MKHRVLVSTGGQPHWLDVEAETTQAAIELAERSGGRVVRVDSRAPAAAARVAYAPPVFLQEALTLLRAGLNIVEVMEALHRKERNPGFRGVLERIVTALREGAPLSEALAREPGLFPPVLVAGISASETSGGLARTLERYIAYDEKLGHIRRKVTASAIYPALLMVVGGGVILFLIAYVLPRFSVILDGSGRESASATRYLIGTGQWIQSHPAMFATALAGAGAALAWLTLTRDGRRAAGARVARLPVLADIVSTLGLSRLYRTLGLLLESGIPLPRALEMTRGIVTPAQSAQLARTIALLRGGQSLTEAMAGTELMPPIAESLLRVGERGGALAPMCEKLADFLDIALDRRVDTFSRLFEPLLMTVIGIVIGAIVLMMYSPIFDLVGSVGQ